MNYYRGLDLLNELYIAATCDHFIGTFSSNLGRLIAEVRHSNEFGTATSLDTGYRLFP